MLGGLCGFTLTFSCWLKMDKIGWMCRSKPIHTQPALHTWNHLFLPCKRFWGRRVKTKEKMQKNSYVWKHYVCLEEVLNTEHTILVTFGVFTELTSLSKICLHETWSKMCTRNHFCCLIFIQDVRTGGFYCRLFSISHMNASKKFRKNYNWKIFVSLWRGIHLLSQGVLPKGKHRNGFRR